MARLRSIPTAVAGMQRSSQSDPPEDMVGLALDGMFQRLRIERDLAREREAAEAAERLAREAADRVFKIEEQAIFVVRDFEAFLQAPLPGHDGKTSRQLAAESISGFAAVQRELDRIREADRAAAEAERLGKDKKTLERCFEVLEDWVKAEQKRGRR